MGQFRGREDSRNKQARQQSELIHDCPMILASTNNLRRSVSINQKFKEPREVIDKWEPGIDHPIDDSAKMGWPVGTSSCRNRPGLACKRLVAI